MMLPMLLNLLFPPKCICCSCILPVGTMLNICDACHGDIQFLEDRTYSSQGLDVFENYCDEILCICEYTGIISKALKRAKFSRKPSYCTTFGKLLANKLKKMTNYRRFDIIVSVPLHKKKFRKRGYNQSYLIASSFSRETGIPASDRLLARIRDTGSQSHLGKSERFYNISGAFKVTKQDCIAGKSVILVDDILTTGNTLNECCKVLKEAGACEVMVAVVASGRNFGIEQGCPSIDNEGMGPNFLMMEE